MDISALAYCVHMHRFIPKVNDIRTLDLISTELIGINEKNPDFGSAKVNLINPVQIEDTKDLPMIRVILLLNLISYLYKSTICIHLYYYGVSLDNIKIFIIN